MFKRGDAVKVVGGLPFYIGKVGIVDFVDQDVEFEYLVRLETDAEGIFAANELELIYE